MTRDIVFLRMFVEEPGYTQEGPTPLALDNEAAIKLSQNKILTGRTKTIQRKENYVREMHHAVLSAVVGSPLNTKPPTL